MRTLKNLGGRVVPGRYRFKEPDISKTFASLKDLVAFAREYREANGLSIEGLQAEIEDWICHEIGSAWYYCLEDGRVMLPPRQVAGQHPNGYDGSAKWRELHEWARDNRHENSAERERWLKDFAASLPCGECRRGWRNLVKENWPPLEGTNLELLVWSIQRHNDIRAKLGQPPMEEAAALALYTP